MYSFLPTAEAISGAGYIQLGHIIKENKRYWLYPSIGIGASAIGLNAYNQVNAVTSNEKINYLVNTSFDFGLNADFVLFGAQVEKKYSCLILGFRTGYRISYANDDWHGEQNDKLIITPSYAYHGFYIMTTIGIASFTKK